MKVLRFHRRFRILRVNRTGDADSRKIRVKTSKARKKKGSPITSRSHNI